MIVSPRLMPALAAGPSSSASATSAPLAPSDRGVGDLAGHRLDLHADEAARDRAVLLAATSTTCSTVVGRDREGDADIAARRRVDRGVHADDLALQVEGRAAGIAAVHRRVDLQEVVIGAGADVAAAGRDDAGRHRAAEAERVADRQHPVADARLPSASCTKG